MMNKPFPTPEFPMEEYKAEREQDHAEFESAIQEVFQKLLAQLKNQNPQLMAAKITKLHDLNISIVLREERLKGILLEYLEQVQSQFYKQIFSQMEEIVGRPVAFDEVVEGLLTIPLSEINKFDQIMDYTNKIVDGLRHVFLTMIDTIIPEEQTIRPEIRICIYLPDCRGAQMFIYAESSSTVLVDEILKPPTVTLDTNIVREWWGNRAKVEHVEKLLELGKEFEIDLAVTRRIHDDIRKPPLVNKINDLPNLNIREIGAVIRVGHWKTGVDTVGIDEFKKIFDSLVASKKFSHMNIDKQPDWRDWDHVHTHYRYGRDYFLTWDSGILHFKKELQDGLGIRVMKPEEYLSCHQPVHLNRLAEKICCPQQNR